MNILWDTDGMIMTGNKEVFGERTFLSLIFFCHTSHTDRPDLGSNPSFRRRSRHMGHDENNNKYSLHNH
jgi:hypothetical protein